MTAARRDRAFGALTGWWATAARLLALVLALSLVAPSAGLAADVAYHDGGGRHVTELASLEAAPEAGATDPGMACHLHCGCHQAAPAVTGFTEPVFGVARPTYARLSEAGTSVSPDRLPRPPRA
ncbi:hypothetical protein [Methylobacterium sp. CM6257]|jgi:hypothetical protein